MSRRKRTEVDGERETQRTQLVEEKNYSSKKNRLVYARKPSTTVEMVSGRERMISFRYPRVLRPST